MAKPDPALGSITGELRFYLGWVQDVAGDHAAAQESWRQARSELEPFLKEQPENFGLMGDLALTSMGLGDKAAAFKLIERAMAVIPIEKDAVCWSYSDRDPGPGIGAHGGARPRHSRITKTAFDTVRWRAGSKRAAHSCAAPARSDVRSVAERSALPKARIGRGEIIIGRNSMLNEKALRYHARRRYEESRSFVRRTSRDHCSDDSTSMRTDCGPHAVCVQDADADAPKRERPGGEHYQGHDSDGDAEGHVVLHAQRFYTDLRIVR